MNSPACTSQPATLDVSTSSLVGDWTPFGEYCTGLINGHLNWFVVTYEGALGYRTWSGVQPQGDDDLNLGLETANQAGQTAAFEGYGNWARVHRVRHRCTLHGALLEKI
jgi:hypothetical protein